VRSGTGADLGKLTAMNEGGVTTTLTYGDPDHPHAVTSRMGSTVASPTSQPDGYTYDHDGNIAARTGGEKYTFDAENRLSTVASYPTQTSYWYDGLGNMDCRWTTTPGALGAADVRDRYVDGLYEEHSVFGQAPVITKNYYAFGRIIAQRKTTTGANPTSSVTYLLADHLGSTVGTVSEAGVSEHMQYYPFGSVRSGRVSTDRGFTGQRREGFSRLGAYFYNARFYATGLGHFMSADTVSTDGLDRYAYVRFNPLRYNDPSGRGRSGV
jgi:RHS repeat-associated protein